PSVPATNVPELISVMKQKGAKGENFGFATSALGSADHLSGEQFKVAAGVDMLVVPYKNSLPAMSDVIAGHLQMGFFTIPGTQPANVDKIGSDVKRVINSPEMAAYMLNNGFEAATSTPAEFADFIRKDSAKTAQVIKDANVKLE